MQNKQRISDSLSNYYIPKRKINGKEMRKKKNTKIAGIYKITNLVNGKMYIGESRNCFSRWQSHKRELKKGRHSNTHLQRAWNKYRIFRHLKSHVPCKTHDNKNYLQWEYK